MSLPSNGPDPALTISTNQDTIEECTHEVKRKIRRLRLDDMASVAQHQTNTGNRVLDERKAWFKLCIINLFYYFGYLVSTWDDVFVSWFRPDISWSDYGSMFFFAFSSSFILLLIYIWCTLSTAPWLVWLYLQTAGRHSGGLGLVNAMNPHLFDNLTSDQAQAAKETLSAAPETVEPQTRTFNLDIAKMLLQISSLMYERSNEKALKAIGSIQIHLHPTGEAASDVAAAEATKEPGAFLTALVGDKKRQAIDDEVDAFEEGSWNAIDSWTRNHKIEFEAVSELASLSQAYASVFWDPESNWIVVAFKGTDPRSFEEWTTDFTASFENAYEDIPGFEMVHRGFKERIFPSKLRSGQRKPWCSISKAVQIVADDLSTRQEAGAKINVWFTGHSLGTALATLAYSKALVGNLGDNVVLRDAYLFATPITVDVKTRHYFNDKMFASDSVASRTMWRVTNRDDFVATGLPAFGDQDTFGIDINNLLGFSHLGIEIFMKSQPHSSEVMGNQVKGFGKFDIHISSKFSQDDAIEQREAAKRNGWTLQPQYSALQLIPVLGRLAAHATVNYYDQLDQIAISKCVDRRPGILSSL